MVVRWDSRTSLRDGGDGRTSLFGADVLLSFLVDEFATVATLDILGSETNRLPDMIGRTNVKLWHIKEKSPRRFKPRSSPLVAPLDLSSVTLFALSCCLLLNSVDMQESIISLDGPSSQTISIFRASQAKERRSNSSCKHGNPRLDSSGSR